MTDKLLRCSEDAWMRLKAAALIQKKTVKTIIDDITMSNMTVTTIEIKQT